jgi:hypothetical protein
MVSIPRFFRKEAESFDDVSIDIHVMNPASETLPSMPYPTAKVFNQPVDPARKALLSRIAVVSVEENANLPALLNEDTRQSAIVRRITLPRNPRIAGDELYELDGMDMIVIVSEESRHISKDMIRWLNLLKQLGVPMLVLLPYVPIKRREQEKIEQFSQYIGLPIVTVTADKLDEARQEFVVTTMRIAPAMGLALAAHIPHFRSPLMQNLMDTALYDSLNANNSDEVAPIQTQLSHQICAAYGRNGQQFETHKAALETLLKTTRHYSSHFVEHLPMKDPQRRARFTNALTTLFTGYATAIYSGATPPSIRKEVLPQIWRLYRESGKPVRK